MTDAEASRDSPRPGTNSGRDVPEIDQAFIAQVGMQRQYEHALTVATALGKSVQVGQLLQGFASSQRALDGDRREQIYRWYEDQAVRATGTLWLRRPPKRSERSHSSQGRVWAADLPISPYLRPDDEQIAAALRLLEAAREEAGSADEVESAVAQFFEDDSKLEQSVSNFTDVVDVSEPEMQKRVRLVIRWGIYLIVIALIAGNWETATAISAALSLFGVTIKDLQQVVDTTARTLMDKHGPKAERG